MQCTRDQNSAVFLNQCSKPYNLTHEIKDNSDDDTSTDDEDDASYNSKEIDLANNTSGDDDEEDDKGVDFSILEAPMDFFDPNHEQEEDNGGNNKEEELTHEAQLNAMVIDDEGTTS
ncbi:hypothetical protein MJO28_014551 [Puccinia striiformis f. sp. tritici]|uniref:Uncharacterized protein n=1 Tax=Puccinia striiformis f. sp. tritici TaxID=168172 RepID=A0ACC0DU95_9BASI|nr:hypothetical protein MJO28_014551 [Puccinia striiformis f. sp. tritici]